MEQTQYSAQAKEIRPTFTPCFGQLNGLYLELVYYLSSLLTAHAFYY